MSKRHMIQKTFLLKPFFMTLMITLQSCALKNQPCAEGGDVSWEPSIIGTMECMQKKNLTSENNHINHGSFRQWHKNGKLALEGSFTDGKREGIWTYTDESGVKKKEKKYKEGVEILLQ